MIRGKGKTMQRPDDMTEAEWAEHLAETNPKAWDAWYSARYREEVQHRSALGNR